MTARLTLRRNDDGEIYLKRYGIEHARIGGVFVHRMSAPDPGKDLHNHPWRFWSLILWGGYVEAVPWEPRPFHVNRMNIRRWGSWQRFDLTQRHRITHLRRRSSWSLVIHGPHKRSWGFFTPDGYVDRQDYDESRRGLGVEL